MIRRILPAFAALLFLTTAAPAWAKPKLVVVSKATDQVQVFDANTYDLLGAVPTGKGPHEVVVSPDGRFAYVGDWASGDNTISVIDVNALKRVKTINVKPQWGPHGLVITKDGSKLYVTTEKSRSAVEVLLPSGKVSRKFETLMMKGHMAALTPDENTLLVANSGTGNISLIDLKTGEVERHIRTGTGAEGIDVRPDGKEIWVTNSVDHNVSVIDAQTRKVVAQLPCEGFPLRVRFTPDGKYALVVSPSMGKLVVFDVASREVAHEVKTGTKPLSVLVAPSGRRAFVSNTHDDQVAVVDLSTFEVTDRFKTAEAPDGIGWAK